MNKYEELRSMCSSSKILCGTELHNLLEEDYMKGLVSKIKDGTVTVKSKMALGTNKVEKYQLFLHNLDRFVYYLKDRLFINPTEFRIYLGYLIESNYIDKILFTKELFEDDSFKFEVYFWQIASERLLGVLGVMAMLDPVKERLEELSFNPKDYNLKKKNDAREVFEFFRGMINCRHDNLFNLFIDNKTIEPERIDFFMWAWCNVLDEYIKKREHYKKFIEIN